LLPFFKILVLLQNDAPWRPIHGARQPDCVRPLPLLTSFVR
jgi:hypothetical protein